MTSIASVVEKILLLPGPVIVLDTCNFLDLFRRDPQNRVPKSESGDLEVVASLLRFVAAPSGRLHLVVPELVPGEFTDHADRIEVDFDRWFRSQDSNAEWLSGAASVVGVPLPLPDPVHPLAIAAGCRKLADELLAAATVLGRDQVCLDRAVSRLVHKRRPSHKKEIKDSMNLEQTLELSRRLRAATLVSDCVFVSSNTGDFAAPESASVHPDLAAEFNDAGLSYFPSLTAAVGNLQSRGQLP